MTAKEALLERVKHLTEEQAEALLRHLPEAGDRPEEREQPSLLEEWRAAWAEVPEEVMARFPSSADVDKVVYGMD